MDEHVYKLRVDTDSISWCQAFVKKYCDQYLFCMENEATANQHCHFYLQKRTDATELAIRKYIQRTIGTGNGAYSLKRLTGILPVEYCAYCIKDQRSDTTIYHNLGEDYIKVLREHNTKVKSEIREKKAAKKSQYQLVIESYEESWNEELTRLSGHDKERFSKPSPETVAHWVINYYLKREQQIRKSTIESLTLTIMCKFHDFIGYLAQDVARFMHTEYRPPPDFYKLPYHSIDNAIEVSDSHKTEIVDGNDKYINREKNIE